MARRPSTPRRRARGPAGTGESGMVSPLPTAQYGDDDTRTPDAEGQYVEASEDSRPLDAQAEDRRRETVRDLLTECRQRFLQCETAESEMRRDMLDDLDFRAGEQWPLELRAQRAVNGSPCLRINRIPQFVRQVVNSARANKPAIQVNPVDGSADPDTAEALQGVCRQIEISSHASAAYETAVEHQAVMGRGWIRVTTQYSDEEGFAQQIRILRVRDPFTVYVDPACTEVDYSDADWAIVTEDLTRAAYKRRFKKTDAELASLDAFMSTGDCPADWLDSDRVRIAEYWYAEYQPYEIAQVLFPDGQEIVTVPKAVLRDRKRAYRQAQAIGDAINEQALDGTDIPGLQVLNTRTVQRRTIKTCLINAVEILDGNPDRTGGRDWPGKWIPLVPVLGDEIYRRGKVDLRGMVRDAKDPQRMYNYWASAATEAIALAPRAPWVGASGQFKGFESRWETANKRNWAYLQYNPVDSGGRMVPAPKRQVEEPAIQAIMIALRQADNDLKAVMGLFDPSLGKAGPEESGKAILARQRQGEVANSNYADNLARAIRRVGYILVDLIPKVYDVPTVLRILGDDDETSKSVMVYAGAQNAPPLPAGIPDLGALAKVQQLSGIYDLGAGQYDVTVTVGPTYHSRRQEAADAMIQVVTRSPELMPIIGDLLFKAMDWPGAKPISKRLARAVPPQYKDPEDGQPEVPPEIQQQMAQMQEQMQAMGQELQQLQMEKAAKGQELAMKGQIALADQKSRERVAAEMAAAQERIAAIEARTALAKVELQGMIEKQQAILQSQLDGLLLRLEGKLDERLALIAAQATESRASSGNGARVS